MSEEANPVRPELELSEAQIAHREKLNAYRAVFASPAGQVVLADLVRSFVDRPRWVPGEAADAGYFREGQASVVQMIQQRIRQAGEL